MKILNENFHEVKRICTSNRFSPGEFVAFDPNIRTHVATERLVKSYKERGEKPLYCFEGSLIKPGMEYCSYRPLLYFTSSKDMEVLKRTFLCNVEYEKLLPTNILEFEEMDYNLQHSYVTGAENKEYNVDWYSVACNYGDALTLRETYRHRKHK